MEVVLDGAGPSSSNIEYEMMQDGANIEEDHAMEYTAYSIHEEGGDEEHVYEFTMEEYGEEGEVEGEGEMKDASQEAYAEEDVMDDAATHVDDGEVEEEEQYNEDEVQGSNHEDEETGHHDENQETGTPVEVTEVEEVVAVIPTEVEEEGTVEEVAVTEVADEAKVPVSPPLAHTETKEAPLPIVEESVKTGEIAAAIDQGAGGGVDSVDPAETEVPTVEEIDEAAANDEEESSAEVHAPPAVRVTFNGQDFVLFPQTEPSTYFAAQETEPIAAPRLKAEEQVYYESMDSLFQTLRVKESLGDFLEEGSELHINFVDLELIIREDDVYAREVSLNDIHRIHLGYGLTSSLHLVVTESIRFITRYNELAAHVAEAVEEGTNKEEEVLEDGVQGETEEEAEPLSTEEQVLGELKRSEDADQQHTVIEQAVTNTEVIGSSEQRAILEEKVEDKEGSKLTIGSIHTQPDETNAIDETTFITVNESAEGEHDGEEQRAEGDEDIIDYDEAYQGEEGQIEGTEAHAEDAEGNAEYEQEEYEVEEEAGEEDQSYEEEATGVETDGDDEETHHEEEVDVQQEEDGAAVQIRLKRSFDDDQSHPEDNGVKSTTADYEESESKRVKTK